MSNFDDFANTNSEVNPIFILGMPRSGTSLVEQILSSHHRVHGGGELSFLTETLIPILQASIQNTNFTLSQNEITFVREKYLKRLGKINTDKERIYEFNPVSNKFFEKSDSNSI